MAIHKWKITLYNRDGCVMVSVLTLDEVDRRFEIRSGKTKDI